MKVCPDCGQAVFGLECAECGRIPYEERGYIEPDKNFNYVYNAPRIEYEEKPVVYGPPLCGICNKKIGGMNKYKCYYCDGIFCEDHHLPENHNCTHIQATSAEVRAGGSPIKYNR